MTTYLAGGINGLTDDECTNWREYAKRHLSGETLDPMRRDYRGREDQCVNEIVEGDKDDIRNSHIVLANCCRPSWGTAMEIMFCWGVGVPVYAVVPDGQPVSPWLRYHCRVYNSLDAAIAAVNAHAA